MMFTRSSIFRLHLLACAAGCAVAFASVPTVSANAAEQKKTSAHSHHAHHAGATHEGASAKAGKKASAKSDTAKSDSAEAKAAHSKKSKHHKKHHAAGHEATATHAAAAKHHPAATAAVGAAAGAGAVAAGTAAADAANPATPPADATPEPPKGTVTGLPLPRYAALRADEVNMRAGPGQRFPIIWVYHRRGMPVRIEREFDVWRLVEDPTGQKGWMQQATLAGGRDFLVPGEPAGDDAPIAPKLDKNGEKIPASGHMDTRVVETVPTLDDAKSIAGAVMLRASASDDAPVVAVLKPGAVGSVKECAAGSAWCRVSVKQYNGWVPRKAIWGVDADEAVNPS